MQKCNQHMPTYYKKYPHGAYVVVHFFFFFGLERFYGLFKQEMQSVCCILGHAPECGLMGVLHPD